MEQLKKYNIFILLGAGYGFVVGLYHLYKVVSKLTLDDITPRDYKISQFIDSESSDSESSDSESSDPESFDSESTDKTYVMPSTYKLKLRKRKSKSI